MLIYPALLVAMAAAIGLFRRRARRPTSSGAVS
jgi:hypothetical protein